MKKKEMERLLILKSLKINSIEIFSKFLFYKRGYIETLGILIFSILSFLTALSAFIYATFFFKAENIYIPVNSINQITEPRPLTEKVYSDNKIRKFSSDALVSLSNYNYVTVDDSYFSDIRKWFTAKSFKNYKKSFLESNESKIVKRNYFVVNSIQIKEATVDQKASRSLRKIAGVYLWVVNLKSNRVYKNRAGFTFEKYKTRMIIRRVPVSVNEMGIAIHSVVNEKIKKD